MIEFPLQGAVGRFRWSFEEWGQGTRITQRCTIAGEEADQYVRGFAPVLEAGVPEGDDQVVPGYGSCGKEGTRRRRGSLRLTRFHPMLLWCAVNPESAGMDRAAANISANEIPLGGVYPGMRALAFAWISAAVGIALCQEGRPAGL